MEYEVDICQLSQDFFAAYPASQYPELMAKNARPYTCLLIETHEDYLICIPFRSSIQHKHAFLFTNTKRSNKTHSGLDYEKVVLIKDSTYISTQNVVVDNDEYTAMMKNISQIVSETHEYISVYKNHMMGSVPLHPKAFEREYRYSTLPYFHDILGIK